MIVGVPSIAKSVRIQVKIVMMVTADYAAVEPQTGKLNVIGVFNRITAKSFPLTYHRMYIAVRLEAEMEDGSEPHQLLITLAGEDGHEMLAIKGDFEMPKSSRGIFPQLEIVCEFNQLKFPAAGDYRIYVRVDDGELVDESCVLQVVQADD